MVKGVLPGLTSKGQNELETIWNKSTCRFAVRSEQLTRNLQKKRNNLPTDTHVSYNPLNQADLIDVVDILFFIKQPSHLSMLPQKLALGIL